MTELGLRRYVAGRGVRLRLAHPTRNAVTTMTRLVDLSDPIHVAADGSSAARLRHVDISTEGDRYMARVYDFAHDGMCGTYIDLPGHVVETDDGADAASVSLERLFRLAAGIVRLDLPDRAGAVTAEMLTSAYRGPDRPAALAINALGARRYDAIEFRSVFLTLDAVDWVVATGCRLLLSDIYESQGIHGVFPKLFSAGISTVCQPVNLHLLEGDGCRVSVLFAPFAGVTQLPCRAVAEI